jgi:tetratricopeptide (TPR) repeat protein
MKKVGLYVMMVLFGSVAFAPVASAAEIVTEKIKVVNPEDYNFHCSKYAKGPDSAKSVQYYSLYREFFKQKNYPEAMRYWNYVYTNAPTLNSRVINNGIEYYQELLDAETQEGARKDELLDSLIMLNYHKLHCYGEAKEDQISILSRIGYLYQVYRPSASEEIKKIYGNVIKMAGNDSPYFVLQPYFSYLLIDLDNDKISPLEVLNVKDQIVAIIAANADDEKYGANYETVGSNIDAIFENNKKVQALFDCEAMKSIWQEQYKTQMNDVEFVKNTYRSMSANKCKDDPFTEELKMQLVKVDPTSNRMMMMASQELKEKDYSNAVTWIEKAIALETDPVKNAENYYKIAEIKYAISKDFAAARNYARKAINLRPNWGKPYLLIGKLYASSGKLCGPGTGFESQKVIWPALDYFNKAKQVDPAIAEDAQELINKYWQYLPETGEMFMLGHKNGDSFYVGCWIGENTTVRTK